MVFREEAINVELARLLYNKGLDAIPESIRRNKKMPDITITIKGIELILECRFNNWHSLVEDTKRRIQDGLCDIGVAVLYDISLKDCSGFNDLHIKLLNQKYNGEVLYQSESGIVHVPFKNLDIKEFVELLNNISKEILNQDVLRNTVAHVQTTLEDLTNYSFRNDLNFDNKTLISELANLLAISNADIKNLKTKKDIIMIALFVLFDAMIFHENIRNTNTTVTSLSYSYAPHKQFFQDEWDRILKIDYRPIFSLALDILTSLPNGIHQTEKILTTIKNLALYILNSGVLQKHDFMGRIYHKLLLKTTGQFYATYYTAVPSAYLLSNLLLKTTHPIWKFNELKFLNNMRIIDPACGSGTLLSACYTALRYIYISELEINEFEKFHKILIEKTIHGWDILDYAVHLTFTILSLHKPNVLINTSNIMRLPNGVDKSGVVRLGSISFLDPELQLGVLDTVNTMNITNQGNIPHEPLQQVKSMYDVVIMNPPFSRSAKPNIKFGYSEKGIKKIMSKKLNNLVKQLNLTGIGQAGMGAVFIVLGDFLLKDSGRIGIVIPRSILTGVSWKKIRDMLYKKYEIKYIISNHDPGNNEEGIEGWNWSEDTNIGEIMLIAEKTDKTIDKRVTTFINLWNKPQNSTDALFLTHQIISKNVNGYLKNGNFNYLTTRNKKVGSYYKVNQKQIKDKWLVPCLFASPILNELAINISKYYPVTKLTELLVDDGIDIKQIKDSFEETDIPSPCKIVWGQQSSINKIFMKRDFINKYGKAKKVNSYEMYTRKKAAFLLSSRPHLDNDCIIAMITEEEVLASAFWELKFKNKKINPLMALWFNSTFGLFMYLSASTSSQGGIFKTKKGQFAYMDVLNPEACPKNLIEKANILYEKIKNTEFQKFHKEFNKASHNKGIRKTIDCFFINEFNINININLYYKELSKEPILTRKRI